MIFDFCLEGYKKEMTDLGKDPDFEIGKFTCNCFLKKVSDNNNLDKALKVCKEEASQKFIF